MNKAKWIILLTIFIVFNILNIKMFGLSNIGVVFVFPLIAGFIAGLIIRKIGG